MYHQSIPKINFAIENVNGELKAVVTLKKHVQKVSSNVALTTFLMWL